MDRVSRETRSRMMAGIKGKNTKPEQIVRKKLFAEGYRFRLHRKDLPGKPDIVLPSRKIAIFVHGCFWHQHQGCKHAKLPKSNTHIWWPKLEKNVLRDAKAIEDLLNIRWRVLVVWECATKDEQQLIVLGKSLSNWIEGDDQYSEIPPQLKQEEANTTGHLDA